MPPGSSFGKQLLEIFRRAFEGLGEAFARLAIELGDGLRQVLHRRIEVGALGLQLGGALFELLHFALGREVHLADALGLGAQLRDAGVVGR